MGQTKAEKKAARKAAKDKRVKESPPLGTAANPEGKETFWRPGEKKPTHYVKVIERPLYPCPNCDRLTDKYGRKSALVASSPDKVVQFTCRCCGNTWVMPVKAAE